MLRVRYTHMQGSKAIGRTSKERLKDFESIYVPRIDKILLVRLKGFHLVVHEHLPQ